METRHRVTLMQLEVLWEYLNSHKEVASGNNKTATARANYQNMWQTVADVLNSFGEGAVKDAKGWAKYWVDYKSKLRRRTRASLNNTEDEAELNDIDKKFITLIGKAKEAAPPSGVSIKSVKPESSTLQDHNYDPLAVEPQQENTLEEEATVMVIMAPDRVIPEKQMNHRNIQKTIQKFDSEAEDDEVGSGVGGSDDGEASVIVVSQQSSKLKSGATSNGLRRKRRRSRLPPFTAEAARRELINISRLRADTEARNAVALEKMLDIWQGIQESLTRIEARLSNRNVQR